MPSRRLFRVVLICLALLLIAIAIWMANRPVIHIDFPAATPTPAAQGSLINSEGEVEMTAKSVTQIQQATFGMALIAAVNLVVDTVQSILGLH